MAVRLRGIVHEGGHHSEYLVGECIRVERGPLAGHRVRNKLRDQDR
jgi:hypothetical protein